jgi:hypothetical protein
VLTGQSRTAEVRLMGPGSTLVGIDQVHQRGAPGWPTKGTPAFKHIAAWQLRNLWLWAVGASTD